MKVFLQKKQELKEAIINIQYPKYSQTIQEIVQIAEGQNVQFTASYRNKEYQLKAASIYYIETVDHLTFLYTKEKIYESKEKLYYLEEKLANTSFLRINKSTILNMNYLKSVQPLPNYRLEATLKNEEKVIINRHYMKRVKNYLNI